MKRTMLLACVCVLLWAGAASASEYKYVYDENWKLLPFPVEETPYFVAPNGKRWFPFELMNCEPLGVQVSALYEDLYEEKTGVRLHRDKTWDPDDAMDPECRSGYVDDPALGGEVCVPFGKILTTAYISSNPFGYCPLPSFTEYDFSLDTKLYYDNGNLLTSAEGAPFVRPDGRYVFYVGSIGGARIGEDMLALIKDVMGFYRSQHGGQVYMVDNREEANVDLWFAPWDPEFVGQFLRENYGIDPSVYLKPYEIRNSQKQHVPGGVSYFYEVKGGKAYQRFYAFVFRSESTGKSVGVFMENPYSPRKVGVVLGMVSGVLGYVPQVIPDDNFSMGEMGAWLSLAPKIANRCQPWDKECLETGMMEAAFQAYADVSNVCPMYVDYGQTVGFDTPIVHMTVAMRNPSDPMKSPEGGIAWYDIQLAAEPFLVPRLDEYFSASIEFRYQVVQVTPLAGDPGCAPAYFFTESMKYLAGLPDDGTLDFGKALGHLFIPVEHMGFQGSWPGEGVLNGRARIERFVTWYLNPKDMKVYDDWYSEYAELGF